jgi:hypothetical protein
MEDLFKLKHDLGASNIGVSLVGEVICVFADFLDTDERLSLEITWNQWMQSRFSLTEVIKCRLKKELKKSRK